MRSRGNAGRMGLPAHPLRKREQKGRNIVYYKKDITKCIEQSMRINGLLGETIREPPLEGKQGKSLAKGVDKQPCLTYNL